jgi:hypothetical protein
MSESRPDRTVLQNDQADQGAGAAAAPDPADAPRVAANPVMTGLVPDVEALVRRTGEGLECYLAPIDAFFDAVRERSRPA